ncbi:MAG: type II toxin-antitoxin system RelE/ParE family toxin [Balneolaceae bacterium]
MMIAWSKKAEKQLDQIFEYIAGGSPFYAYRTTQNIIETAENVPKQPQKGRMVPEYQREDIREVFYHPYRIIYLLSGEQIEILSVIHERRLLSGDPE